MLADLWRGIIQMRDVVWLLPTTLYNASTGHGASREVITDVNAGRAFTVNALRGGPHARLEVRPPAITMQGGVVFGQTTGNLNRVFVAYTTCRGPLPRRSRSRSQRELEHDVFRQAKVSETVVHEVVVHGVALLAPDWRTGHSHTDHYDGFGDSLTRDRSR